MGANDDDLDILTCLMCTSACNPLTTYRPLCAFAILCYVIIKLMGEMSHDKQKQLTSYSIFLSSSKIE